jgi:hypothetical protein
LIPYYFVSGLYYYMIYFKLRMINNDNIQAHMLYIQW